MMQRLACAIALTCMLAGLVGPALAEIPADTANLSLSCELQLDDVLALYDERGNITAQNGTVVCDEACKEDCGKKVRNAIYPSKNSDCIRKTKLAACFQHFAGDWEAYVQKCELFDYVNATEAAESTYDPKNCFPDFQNSTDFAGWMAGTWEETSGAAGLGVSLAALLLAGVAAVLALGA